MKNKIIVTVMAMAMAAFLVGCSDSKDDPIDPVDPETPKTLSMSISTDKIDESSAEIIIRAQNAVKLSYVCIPTSETTPSVDTILENGTAISVISEQTIKIENLDSGSEYSFVLAAKGSDDATTIQTKSFVTLQKETPPVDDTVFMEDGFLFYDGISESTGLYNTTIIMSSKSMSAPNTEGYCDVIIGVYTRSPLTIADSNKYYVPYGVITPYYTDGTELGDMVYHIGMHTTDSDGTPNYQGTAWLYYDVDENSDIYVASDTAKTRIEIIDNNDETYTVKGVLVDSTLDKELKFSFTNDKLVMGGWN